MHIWRLLEMRSAEYYCQLEMGRHKVGKEKYSKSAKRDAH